MTDDFDARLRQRILRAVAVADEPTTADQMAAVAMRSRARTTRLAKTLAVAGSAGAVAATVVLVTVLGTSEHGGRPQPGNQPVSPPARTCTTHANPSVPPVTTSAGQPGATGSKTQSRRGGSTSPTTRQAASCPPTPSMGAGTASATASYHR